MVCLDGSRVGGEVARRVNAAESARPGALSFSHGDAVTRFKPRRDGDRGQSTNRSKDKLAAKKAAVPGEETRKRSKGPLRLPRSDAHSAVSRRTLMNRAGSRPGRSCWQGIKSRGDVTMKYPWKWWAGVLVGGAVLAVWPAFAGLPAGPRPPRPPIGFCSRWKAFPSAVVKVRWSKPCRSSPGCGRSAWTCGRDGWWWSTSPRWSTRSGWPTP